jgi:uncharacterized protein (DUF1800 family)
MSGVDTDLPVREAEHPHSAVTKIDSGGLASRAAHGAHAQAQAQTHGRDPADLRWLAALPAAALSACGGGGGDPAAGGSPNGQDVPPPVFRTYQDSASGLIMAAGLPGATSVEPASQPGLSLSDASRFLTQATFGIRSPEQVAALQSEGLEHWLWAQFNAPVALHTSFLDKQRGTDKTTGEPATAGEDLSYQAIWRQWLLDDGGQLRARVAFALSQIFVISNIAPDVPAYGMSSYMDMLNHHAFGNHRTLLEAVTRHSAMGYYLNMLSSTKEDPETGNHPNENYAREVLQLFSIGLVKLDIDGTPLVDAQNKAIPTYDEAVVKGFARAFSGWSFGKARKGNELNFDNPDLGMDDNWRDGLKAFPERHETGTKQLLNGTVLPAGQSQEKDLSDALDNIFQHPNVGPFMARQLIQRLVTSNPSKDYIKAVAQVFNDNGKGVRGDLKAVVRAALLHAEARGDAALAGVDQGKLREPVIRLANVLRALGVQASDAVGSSNFWYLFGGDMPLGQHPLLAPSVFNFFAPGFRPAGALAQRGLTAPEFQITTETTIVTTYNVFYSTMYGWDEQYGLKRDFSPWTALARQADKLIDRMNLVLFNQRMSTATRQRLSTLLARIPAHDEWGDRQRVNAAFVLAAVSPDFVVQK